VAELYKTKIQRLHEALTKPSICAEAGAVLRSLIARIVLTPNESGGLNADLHGELATVIQLANCPVEKLSSQLGSGAGRFALVAGAGFEPAAFRL
jgi:site-specific DNA recombinase